MAEMIRKHGLNAIIVILILALAGSMYYWIWWAESRPPVNNAAPHFEVVNQTGETADFFKLNGKVRLVYFFKNTSSAVQDMVNLQQTLKSKGIALSDVLFIPVMLNKESITDQINSFKSKTDLTNWWFPEADSSQIVSLFRLKEQQPGTPYQTGDYIIVETDKSDWMRRIINGSFQGNAFNIEDGSHDKASLLQDINIMLEEK